MKARDKYKHPKPPETQEKQEKQEKQDTLLQVDIGISFEEIRDICGTLYALKEDQHLIYRRLIDPEKNAFEDSHKFLPDGITTGFLNNVGLLFHKVMVARELLYLLEHYVEQTEVFNENKSNLEVLLREIDELFEEGLEILEVVHSQQLG